MTLKKYWLYLISIIGVSFLVANADPLGKRGINTFAYYNLDTPTVDSTKLPFPIVDTRNSGDKNPNPFNMGNTGVKKSVEYDPATGKYILRERIGNFDVKPPVYMTFQEYMAYQSKNSEQAYWKEKASVTKGDVLSQVADNLNMPKLNLPPELSKRLGPVDIRPQGSAELIFALNSNRIDNPALNIRQRRFTQFDFDMNIQMNVTGNIGDKIKLNATQNTQAVFKFDNIMKLGYTGKEDEIVKEINAGNVSLPLKSSLIQGSQSLFGVRTGFQFGRLRVTTVLSQQQGQNQSITAEGGAQATKFEIKANQYDGNKHFFLTQMFRDQYNQAMSGLPLIRSGIVVTRVEVWVTRRFTNFQNPDVRNVMAFMDLAEPQGKIYDKTGTIVPLPNQPYPSNTANTLYNQLLADPALRKANGVIQQLQVGALSALQNTRDYEFTFGRRLEANEFTFNSQLGFISLNSALQNDEVLGVAFEYTYNGKVYRVGEFSQEVSTDQNDPSVLFLKMLKGTNIRVDLPIWDLMMKNIYSLNAYDLSPEDFTLNIIYADVLTGFKNFVPAGSIAGQPLIRVLNLDSLNVQLEPIPDGFFDFIPNVTIDTRNGRVIFPILEPFGSDLRKRFINPETGLPDDPQIVNRFVYEELYDSTRAWAMQFPSKDRFLLVGKYRGTQSNEISLNALNVPPGSVVVRAGNRVLQENIDYRVDYVLGKVYILNPGIQNSGDPISVDFENNPILASPTQRNISAARFDYMVSKNLNLGATVLNMTERPLTQKVLLGSESVSNTIIGFDGNLNKDSRMLTRMIDRIPLINTKEVSNITLNAEYAHFFPGNSKAISQDGGISYIDDFEGSENSLDMRLPINWTLSSTPKRFAESNVLDNDLRYGFNRAQLAWYFIDPMFLNITNITPSHISNDRNMRSTPYMREILQQEVFPNRQLANTQPVNIQTLDLAFYPSVRGPYNYDAINVAADGSLLNPTKRWGGIMRKISTNDFEAANIEYIEFWVMDPYLNDNYEYNGNPGGDLYFNLGNSISEDILKDGRRSFENGLPRTDDPAQVDTTGWGVVSRLQPFNNAFDNDPATRQAQDVGLDGLNDGKEAGFFSTFLQQANAVLDPAAYAALAADPSSDNYHHFRGTDYDNVQLDILSRYKLFNGLEGNSPASENTTETYPTSATNLPNNEDINDDNVLIQSAQEGYWEYKVSLKPDASGLISSKYLVDYFEAPVTNLPNGTSKRVKWYQFRIPVQKPDEKVGNIVDYKSIRFMRMYMTGFSESAVMRFATLQLVRNDWRQYAGNIEAPGEYIPVEDDDTFFFLSTVNIEENGNRDPNKYVVPPGIVRQVNSLATNFQQLNEQSISLKFCNLEDGASRAVFKSTGFDIRAYKRIRMFIHAEGDELRSGDVRAFMRFGNDFVSNYYEYEVPLRPSIVGGDEPEEVWPLENELNTTFEALNNVKKMRNAANWDYSLPYTAFDSIGNKITIIGNPVLSNVEVVMLGVRNPKNEGNGKDDGLAKCGEVWFNELRMTDFDNRDSWAATAQANVRLANLGTVTFASTYKKIGWGSVDSRPMLRSREDIFEYDLGSNIELGRFFPDRMGVRIPMYWGISERFVTPEYNPTNPDLLLSQQLNEADDAQTRKDILNAARTYNKRRSLNFTNISKAKNKAAGKTAKKTTPFDITNFGLNYAFQEEYLRDPFTLNNTRTKHRGGLNYNFSSQYKPWKPFKGIKSKNLALITDLSITPLPNTLAFRTDIERIYQEIEFRDNTGYDIIIPPNIFKNFTMNRFYTLQWNITRSLQVDFNATANNRIDEPAGRIDTQSAKDSVWNNILALGRPTGYNQMMNISYNLPLSKIKMLNWMTASVKYGTTYDWTAARLSALEFGNSIQNAQTKQGQMQLNFTTLYNKVGILKRINSDQPLFPEKKKTNAVDTTKTKEEKVLNQFGEEENKVKKKREDEFDLSGMALRTAGRLLMTVRNFSLNYSENNGTLIPGFNQVPQYLGNNTQINAPGYDFVFGKQFPYSDINTLNAFQQRMIDNSWLVPDTSMNMLSIYTFSKNLTMRSQLEPIRDLKIDLNWTYTENSRLQENFRFASPKDDYPTKFNPLESGSFSISTISLRTAFSKIDKTDSANAYNSPIFREFESNRHIIANRLAETDPYSVSVPTTVDGEFPTGYSGKSPDVLIPAFFATYTGKDLNSSSLDFRPTRIPLPNWNLTYNGLTRMKWAKKYFKSFNITHAYRSTYSVGNFTTNLMYLQDLNTFGQPRDPAIDTMDFRPMNQIAAVTISEQFAPLLGLDFTLVNSLSGRIEYRKTRALSLSLVNTRLTENLSEEFTMGLGYRIAKPRFGFLFNGKPLPNSINFRFDFSIRDNIQIARDLDGKLSQPLGGIRTVSLRPNAEYQVNNRVTIRLFLDRMVNKPYTSLSFPSYNTRGGLSVRFSLAK